MCTPINTQLQLPLCPKQLEASLNKTLNRHFCSSRFLPPALKRHLWLASGAGRPLVIGRSRCHSQLPVKQRQITISVPPQGELSENPPLKRCPRGRGGPCRGEQHGRTPLTHLLRCFPAVHSEMRFTDNFYKFSSRVCAPPCTRTRRRSSVFARTTHSFS